MKRITKFGCLGLTVLIAVWIVSGYIPVTVKEASKRYTYDTNLTFGYKVHGHLWRTNGFGVTIWADSSLKMQFEVPGIELVRVKTERWLADDRAILLELDYIYHDSIDFSGEMAILYDFERGELHSFGELSAWFVSAPEHRRSRKATRAEFDTIVEQLSGPGRPR